MNAHIQRAVQTAGGVAALAKAVGVKTQAVSQWLSGQTRPSPQNARAIEEATGGVVLRAQLRPDVFGDAALSGACSLSETI